MHGIGNNAKLFLPDTDFISAPVQSGGNDETELEPGITLPAPLPPVHSVPEFPRAAQDLTARLSFDDGDIALIRGLVGVNKSIDFIFC